jgi:hypothetical protein
MPLPEAAQLEQLVLVALVQAYEARAGVKERMRSISEYEIARRVGMADYSYAEYADSEERDVVQGALSRLQARGLVRLASVAGRYETFEPSAAAMAGLRTAAVPDAGQPVTAVEETPTAGLGAGLEMGRVEQRLDEIVRLLRSIDAHLAGER